MKEKHPDRNGRTSIETAVQTLLIAWSVGVMTGALYTLPLLFKRFILDRFIFHGRDVLWMAPLGSALFFIGIAFLGVLPLMLFRKRIPSAFAIGFFVFLGLFSLMVPYGSLARWAVALLALGVAVHVGRQVHRAPGRWARGLIRLGIVVTVVVGVLGLGQRGVRTIQSKVAIARLPEAKQDAPNILLIILDTVRGESMSLYGYQKPTTPALMRWASRGTVFDNAFATTSWTLPSHGSIFTGRLGNDLGGSWLVPIQGGAPTLPEVLRESGYLTGGFVANLVYTSYESGFTKGIMELHDYPLSLAQVLLNCPLFQTAVFGPERRRELVQSALSARSLGDVWQILRRVSFKKIRQPADEYVPASVITDNFLNWQAQVNAPPFFAFLNYFDAHGPYRAPPEFAARLASGEADTARYDAAIAYLDAELDRLFRTLEQRGVLSHTLVVVSSDHGELFGEHGMQGHANALYVPLLRVPLIMLYPGRVPAGLRVMKPVSLRDLPATILDLSIGANAATLPGVSLAGTWDSTRGSVVPSAVVSQLIRGRYPNNPKFRNSDTWLESLIDDRYHFIRSGEGEEELYDWREDPRELNEMSTSADGIAHLPGLRARLDSAIRR